MSIRYHHDLYPRTDPKDGTKVRRFTKLQEGSYTGQRNGSGAGQIAISGRDTEAADIDPAGLQYVRVVREDTSDSSEAVVGGYWLEQGDFLALGRPNTKRLTFGGAGTLAYLDRAVMWSHTYLNAAGELADEISGADPFDDIWRLYASGIGATNTLGGALYRAVAEAMSYQDGAYSHRHADGTLHTDTHDDDRTATALPDLTLGFTASADSDGNAWTVEAGEFTAQVGESLYSVVQRLMDAGLYVEMDPDTFELNAWEVANHGRDRTGAAWGSDVIRFNPPASSTDHADGNILNDLKRAIRAMFTRTSVLAGGQDTFGYATASGDVRWEGFVPSDANNTDALDTIASRDITRRNDAGDTVQVRIKVGTDTSNGYYLPGEDILPDDLVTLHSGTGTWDWNESSYPVASWSITSRRTGQPDAFVSLGASYHSTGDSKFQSGSGVGRHTHPPNPRPCDPATIVDLTTDASWKALLLGYRDSGGELVVVNAEPDGWKETGFDDSAWTTVVAATGSDYDQIRFDNSDAKRRREEQILRKEFFLNEDDLEGDDVTFKYIFDNGGTVYINGTQVATQNTPFDTSTPTEVSTTIARNKFVAGLNTVAIYVWNEDTGTNGATPPGVMKAGLYIDIPTGDPTPGNSPRVSRCDHGHLHNDLVNRNVPGAHTAAAIAVADALSNFTGTNVETVLAELQANIDAITSGGPETVNTITDSGASQTLDLDDGTIHDVTLTDGCAITLTGATAGQGESMTVIFRQDSTGSRTPTLPDSVAWVGGVTPTWQTAANAIDVIALLTIDGGTSWIGVHLGSSSVGELDDLSDVTITSAANGDLIQRVSGTFVNKQAADVGHYEVLIAAGSDPAEPLGDGAGDWLYVWVTD